MKRPTLIRPEDSLLLLGMERADIDRSEATLLAQVEQVNALLRQPGPSIDHLTGQTERESPLFFGTGNNPTLF